MDEGRIRKTAVLIEESATRVFVLRTYATYGEWLELRDGEHATGIKEEWPAHVNPESAIESLEVKALNEWPGIIIKSNA